jgi:hypothetical protein
MRWITLALALALAAPALAQDGSGTLIGSTKAKVKGCGKDHLPTSWGFQSTAGEWTATVGGLASLSGTAVAVGSSGKIWNLAFDGESKQSFDDSLEDWATQLCGTAVTLVDPTSIPHFNLKLNKRRTRAKLTLFAHGTGATIEGEGKGKLKSILRGQWQDAQ